MIIRIATRQSALALWQAEHVAARLRSLDGIDDVELLPMTTRGDRVLDRSLQKIGGKGLFIKELEMAIAEGRADIAVHSMKDVPADMPAGFRLAVLLPRGNPLDALVSPAGYSIETLPPQARVGSSSLRRRAQLLALRADVAIEPLRGNVNTRLAKLDQGAYDAIVLACAGLERLGLADRIGSTLSPREMLPAAAQGVIGIECREDAEDLQGLLTALDDPDARATTAAERAVSRRLEASCQSPVASYATLDGDRLHLTALVASHDGRRMLCESASGTRGDADALGASLAGRLLDRGAGEFLAAGD
ncbi:MAG: hydroxymethylbilane synthase [Woeseiaceae bacterium]|nr:hydroxymethylbilane synthase [Woeseiaceae bacterium]